MRLIPVMVAASLSVHASAQGVPVRAGVSDYPAHQTVNGATLAAAIVPVSQIEKMFSADIAKHYVVLEAAVYPQNGQAVDIDWLNFAVEIGDMVSYVEKPRDVATPWQEKSRIPDKSPTVTTTTGVVYGRSSDPVYGRRSEWGVYEGVSVTNDPRASTPPPIQSDPQLVEKRIFERMLPEGRTANAVAGYLFFPQYRMKRHKGAAVEFRWSRPNTALTLHLTDK